MVFFGYVESWFGSDEEKNVFCVLVFYLEVNIDYFLCMLMSNKNFDCW